VAASRPVVRSARQEDVPAVLELWALARSAHALSADTPEVVERLIADAPDALIVADAGGEVVGVLIAAWDGWRGNMYRLAIHPDRRREGIGLSLVQAGEERLRARGAHRITALVAYEDKVAGGLWEAAGYELDRAIGRFARNL
jgi:ribosomal protein S18 acetylase RimI-like enzyme